MGNISRKFSTFSDAVKNWNWDLIDRFIVNGSDINKSLIPTGPLAGYTALYFAAMEDRGECATKLLRIYKVSANSVGANGAQPIHLACLLGSLKVLAIFLESGANFNAEFTKELREKYIDYFKNWSDDFGGKMTLLTFVVLNNKFALARYLLEYGADFKIRGRKNKTLLMYAIENDDDYIALVLLRKIAACREIMDARDDDGLHAVHYLLFDHKIAKDQILLYLIESGADVNATIDGDPDTMLLNMAARSHRLEFLKKLLDLKLPVSKKSKVLFNATSGSEEIEQRKCVEFVLENLIIRRKFGLFVPEEETKFMDQLVASDVGVKKFVNKFAKKFVNSSLKNQKINCEDGDMSVYEFVKKVLDDRALKLLVKDEKLVEGFREFVRIRATQKKKTYEIFKIVFDKFEKAYERRKILEKVQKIQGLRQAIPLPYEIVLYIIEFVDNWSLQQFVEPEGS
ncbi:uncharacterized protein LOC123271353 [Cotesia glomerata]|uniref:uncharacterized protein LOC123271353 n=1 Tax=Cotesia glomerata TaxID=32391 RepID=UPI001D00737A|nr:uncharacterized protein LOC123271353 [Cotesia glomerata]